MKKLKVTVEGKSYLVTVEPLAEDTSLLESPAQAPPAPPPPTEGNTPIPSPLAGKVVTIDIRPGQPVQEGDQLMVLEAMKMNTYLYAPQNGSIARVLVSEGDAVEEGQPLIIMA